MNDWMKKMDMSAFLFNSLAAKLMEMYCIKKKKNENREILKIPGKYLEFGI